MPINTVKRHSNDRPWITDSFRNLLLKRDQAYKTNNPLYKFYRNRVNTARRRLRKNYYASKAQQVCSGEAKWWRNVRELAGMRSKTARGLQGLANNVSQGDMGALAQMTNSFFQAVCAGLQLITMESDFTGGDEYHLEAEYIITVESVERRLMQLDPRKVAGPDGIPTWVLRNFAGCLAPLLASIFKSSLREGQLPFQWKCAGVVPIPKVNRPCSVEKDLRPISLTSVLCKELESYICAYILRSARHLLDPFQYGAIQGCSTVDAPVELWHNWAVATDDPNSMVRILFLDYRKAFDHIDHNILLTKMAQLGLPSFMVRWLTGFLCERQQRVRMGGHTSDWLRVLGRMPQGTRTGPIAFLFMINDLLSNRHHAKFVDDTTVWEL